MTDEEQIIEKKALEMTAQHYLEKMLKSGWKATHSDKRFDHWDVTITNNTDTYYTETKIRFINPEDYKDEGAIIDNLKVGFLTAFGKSIVVQFFPASNSAYVWPLSEIGKWKQGKRWCKRNHYTEERWEKKVWYMPFDEEHKRCVDMSDFDEILKNNIKKVKDEGLWK